MLQFVSWCGYYGVPGVNRVTGGGGRRRKCCSLYLGVGTMGCQV